MALLIVEHFAPNMANARPIKNFIPRLVELQGNSGKETQHETSDFHMLKVTDPLNNQEELWSLLLKVTGTVMSIVSMEVKEKKIEEYPKHFAQILAGVLQKIQSIFPQVSEVRIHESTGPKGVKKKVVDALRQSWVIAIWHHKKIADDWTVLPRTSTGAWYLTLPEQPIQ